MKYRVRTSMAAAVAAFMLATSLYVKSPDVDAKGEFSHRTAAHRKIDCASCHKVPSGNWALARKYPDVADFPGHASCINCHRGDFFAGNKPAICSICHANPGPRGAGRLPFPVRSRSQEFATIFPHNVHQDLIAKIERQPAIGVAHLVNASFVRRFDDERPEFNNCAICHKTPAALPKFEARKVTKSQPLGEPEAETVKSTAAFFKDSPDNHASCFNCHYANAKPMRTDCAGCHSLTSSHFDVSSITRYSLKFNHSDKDHVNKDCTTCHVRITQNADVRKMVDADVPFLTCSTTSCHGKNIAEETGKREASIAAGQPAFQCTYCHSSAIGRYPIPASHRSR